MFSLILSQALLMSKLSSKLSKAANLFDISTWYISLTCTSSRFSDQIYLNHTFALLIYLLKFSPLILPLPGSGQYHKTTGTKNYTTGSNLS
jgi:hypothetical protein